MTLSLPPLAPSVPSRPTTRSRERRFCACLCGGVPPFPTFLVHKLHLGRHLPGKLPLPNGATVPGSTSSYLLSTYGFAASILLDMAATLDALAREALVLRTDQRIALAHQLLNRIEADPDPLADAAWKQEIAWRLTRLDAGETTAIPTAGVFARLERIAPDRP